MAWAAGMTPENPIAKNRVALKDLKRPEERAGESRVMMARMPSMVIEVR